MPYRFVDEEPEVQETPSKGKFRFVDEEPKERSFLQKAGRVGAQFGIGAAESALMPLELGLAPLGSKEAMQVPYRENLGEDIERLLEQKQTGVWDKQDEDLLENLKAQLQDPSKSEQFIKTSPIHGVRSAVETATGLDLHPEGILEKAANWTGFLKNPSNLKKLKNVGLPPKKLGEALGITGKDIARGLGAGTGLEMAEQGDFGPIGTLGAAIAGDVAGGGVAALGKAALQPKETLSKVFASFTPKKKLALQKDIIKDFKEAGIQADIGTLTDSNLMKFMQSRLAQSGLTGRKLDELRDTMTRQIKEEYSSIASSLGEAKFATSYEAGEVLQKAMRNMRAEDLSEVREFYNEARQSLRQEAVVPVDKILEKVTNIEKELSPGKIKSVEQKAVLDAIEKIKGDLDIIGPSGNVAYVQDLINTKLALNDIINYEVQGGAKQYLKGIVADLDKAITDHGKENLKFGMNYKLANERFAQHAKTYRAPEMDRLLRDTTNPTQILTKMNSVQGIRNIEKALGSDKEAFEQLKRHKLEELIGDNMVDSTTQQIKLGTFSKLLEKGKNAEVVQELLGKENFKRLERLMRNTNRLYDTAQKFYNASKSGVVVEDIAVVATVLKNLTSAFAGNVFPIIKTGGMIAAGNYITRLIGDPAFLKMVEEAVLAAGQDNTKRMLAIGEQMLPIIKAAIATSQERLQDTRTEVQ